MRPKGEGSVYRRNDGRWIAQLEAGHYPNGKRRRRRRTRNTRREAIDALRAMQRAGDLPTDTLGDYLAVWIEAAQTSRAPKTIAAYRCDLAHVTRAIGHVRLADVTPAHVRAMLSGLSLSPKSVLNVRTTLHTALQDATMDGMIPTNPVARVARPRVPRQEASHLTLPEAERLLAALDGDRHEALWTVCMALGLRLAEALGLTWDRVGDGQLQVRHQLRRVDGTYTLADLKNRKVRDLPLPGFVAEALREHRRRQLEERLAAEWWPDTLGLVFTTGPERQAGYPLTDTVPRNALGRLSEDVLGRRVKPHDLRHTAATLLIARGVPLSMVQDILGHSSIQVTKDMYGHLSVEDLRPGADAMDDLLGR